VAFAQLTRPTVGRLAAVAFRDRIPHSGVRFDTSDPAIPDRVKAALALNLYERAELRFLHAYLRPDLDVVEVGGSMGVMATNIAQLQAPGHRLVTVEANPRLVPVLERHAIGLAPPGRSVEVLHAAIDYGGGDTVGLAFGDTSTNARVGAEAGLGTVDVPALTLTELLDERGLDGYVLIADIEGAEAGLLEHDRAALDRCAQAIIELHDTELEGRPIGWHELGERFVADTGMRLVDQHGPVVVLER
jgi:FkbM family methyltransferase